MKHKKYLFRFLGVLLISFLTAGTNLLYAQNGTTTGNGTTTEIADSREPSDVENVKAVAGDSEVLLTWDAATDNVGVTGYKLYRGTQSVKTPEANYDLPVIPLEAVDRYIVKNLTNGKTYYFTVTALDAAGNESVNYSTEVNATPQSGLSVSAPEDDGKPPQVKSVESEDIITVKVVFSEPVNLPEEHPVSAFQIEKISDKSRLAVQQAVSDNRDATGATILLTTAPQTENEEYLLTAGLEIQDHFKNPIVSGTADTGSFRGSAKKQQVEAPVTSVGTSVETKSEPEAIPKDIVSPKITGGAADFGNSISLVFSEKIVLPRLAAEAFTVYKKGTEDKLRVLNASLSVDGKTVYLTTDPQQTAEYEVRTSGVKDEAGNLLDSAFSSVIVAARGSGSEDTTPPEDVTELTAKIKDKKTNLVELRWKASKNSANDLADQALYQSEGKDGTSFGAGASLGSSTVIAEVEDLKGGKWYTFKLTAKDDKGNESKGATTAIYLPKTGPGMVAAGLASILMGWYRRRKR